MQFSLNAIATVRYVNLIPFNKPMITNGNVNFSEMYLNTLIFAPLGMYMAMLKPRWHFSIKLLLILLVSFSFETLQYVLMVGSTDATDIVTNTIGGILGLIFYKVIASIFKSYTPYILLTFSLIGTISFIASISIFIK